MSTSETKGQHTQRYFLCTTLFMLKASLAVLLGSLGLGFNAYKVQQLYSSSRPINYYVEIDPTKCFRPQTSLARLEPPNSTVMFGFHYDWIGDNPLTVSPRVKFNPAISNAYLEVDSTKSPTFDKPMWDWHAEQVQKIGGVLAMTLQPLTINNISDAQVEELADQCLRTNSIYGVPMFFRFAHEMNGDWAAYGMQPSAFINAFQRLSVAIHKKTNMTAMVFGPNIGISYPYTTPGALSRAPTLASNPTDFRLLDSNGDGVINSFDDPYMPYYPGDLYVDWVAISIYFYPDRITGFNALPPLTYFQDMLTSSGPSMAISDNTKNGDPLRNFYRRFVIEHNKPMMIPETSAPYTPSITNGTATNAQVKERWYEQIFSQNNTVNNFPRLKAVVQFEEQKSDGGGAPVQDWRVLADPSVLSSFLGVLNRVRPAISFATDFTVDCAGNWIPKK